MQNLGFGNTFRHPAVSSPLATSPPVLAQMDIDEDGGDAVVTSFESKLKMSFRWEMK
jgi:hypothetical protein